MGFGKKKSDPTPAPVKPQIVVSPGSGSGLTDGATAQQAQRVETATPQTSLLTQNDEDDKLKKGIG
jgi:hypothetical protein